MIKLPIVFAGNDEYIKYTSVTIASLISNASKEIFYEIFILSEDISNENKELLSNWIRKYKNFSIDYITLNEIQNENLHVDAHLNNATYYRLYIPKLFENYDRVLYLDSDIIVDYDISDLATMDFEDSILMGVTDYASDYVEQDHVNFSKKYFFEVLKLKDPKKYINAGFALFNIKKIRELGIQNEFIKIIREIEKPKTHDQDLLNAVAGRYGEIKIISKKYNYLTVYQDDINIGYWFIFKNTILKLLRLRNKNTVPFYIYHFSTSLKPWNSTRRSKRLFYKYICSKYLAKPPKKFITQIFEQDKYKYPLYWKLFMKYFSY